MTDSIRTIARDHVLRLSWTASTGGGGQGVHLDVGQRLGVRPHERDGFDDSDRVEDQLDTMVYSRACPSPKLDPANSLDFRPVWARHLGPTCGYP